MAILLLSVLALVPMAFLFEALLILDGFRNGFGGSFGGGVQGAGEQETGALFAVLALVMFSTELATIVYFTVAVRAGAGFLSMVNYLVAALAVLLGAVLLGAVLLDEALTPKTLVAMVLILLGIRIAGTATRTH